MLSIVARFAAIAFLIILGMPSTASAACAMCSAYEGCYIIEGDGFLNCSNNSCSGTCRHYYCPELPCYFREEVDPGDAKSAADSCGASSWMGRSVRSSNMPSQIFELSGGDQLLAQAVLQFESLAREGRLANTGAFQFAIAQNEEQLSAVMAGRKLRIEAYKAPTSGFADYVADFDSVGTVTVSMRIWQVAYPETQPLGGLSTTLRYAAEGNTMTLASQNPFYVMPEIRAEYMAMRSTAPDSRLREWITERVK